MQNKITYEGEIPNQDVYEDIYLPCIDCPDSNIFTFSAQDQKSFNEKSYYYPKRCPQHQRLKKNHMKTGNTDSVVFRHTTWPKK